MSRNIHQGLGDRIDPIKMRLLDALFHTHVTTNGAYVKAVTIIRAALRNDPKHTAEEDNSLSDPDGPLVLLAANYDNALVDLFHIQIEGISFVEVRGHWGTGDKRFPRALPLFRECRLTSSGVERMKTGKES